MITGSPGLSRFSSASRPKPFIPAIRTSLSTRSAVDSGNSLSACSALSASVTRCPPLSKAAAIMRRMLRSSSTTRMLANRFLPYRNVDSKSGPAPEFAAREDPAVVRLDDFLRDIQPESRRANVRCIIGELREWFEDARQNIRRDAGPVVGHDRARDVALAMNLQLDGTAVGRVAQRVTDQIGDYPRQLDRIAPNRDRTIIGDDVEGDLFFARLDRQRTACLAHGFIQHDGAPLDPDTRGTFPGRIEQVGRDRVEARHILMNRVEDLSLARRDLGRNRFGEQLGAYRQRRERRLKLMRERRDQIGAALFLITHVGHVLQQHDSAEPLAIRTHPGKVAAQIAVIASPQEQLELRTVVAGPVAAFLIGGEQLRDVQIARGNLLEPRSFNLVRTEIEDRARDLIYMDDRMILIEHDQPILDAFDDRVGLGALMVEFGETRFVAFQLFLLQRFELLQDWLQLG